MARLHKVLQKYGKGSLSRPDILRAVFKGEWSAAKKAQKKEQKEKEKAEKKGEKHTPSNGEVKAVLWKDSTYNQNCYDHIEGDGGRKAIFQKFQFVDAAYASQYPKLPGMFKEYYGFPGKIKCNFNPGAELKGKTTAKNKKKGSGGNQRVAGCSKPYKWNGHHMIPAEAFYAEVTTSGGGKPVFTPNQYALLLMSDYNLNNGHNLMPLPDRGMDFYQPVHAMILHPSSHSNYTAKVKSEMQKISNSLKNLEAEADKPHPDISVDLKNELTTLEKQLWKLLVKLGKAMVSSTLANTTSPLTPEEKGLVGDNASYGALI